MMVAASRSAAPSTRGRAWFVIGLLLLAYCVLGNYFVLPGYRRFLQHGSSRGAGSADVMLIWGAAKTILWMLSFHLGAFCLATGALAAQGEAARSFRRAFAVAAIAWLAVWTIPTLPGPFTEFFAAVGVVIIAMIAIVFANATAGAGGATGSGNWLIASCFFFALATWDICGLGSVGGILHPDSAVRAASQKLVVTQTTKLIIEMALAWTLLAIGGLSARSVAD